MNSNMVATPEVQAVMLHMGAVLISQHDGSHLAVVVPAGERGESGCGERGGGGGEGKWGMVGHTDGKLRSAARGHQHPPHWGRAGAPLTICAARPERPGQRCGRKVASRRR